MKLSQADGTFPHCFLISLAVVIFAALLSGCGGGGGGGFSGNTNVTLFATGAANDQTTIFAVGMNQLTLTDQNGKTVNLLTSPTGPDVMLVNGLLEPLATASIPQGVYTSASIAPAGAGYICDGFNTSAGSVSSDDAYFSQLAADSVTVKLTSPITITGQDMGLVLNLLVSQSVAISPPCWKGQLGETLTPAFVLSPVSISAQGARAGAGTMSGLQGTVASIDPSGTFSVTAIDYAATWQLASNASTVYQGVTNPSQLAIGMAVDFDATLQPDGSLLATRIEAYDTNASTPSVIMGPLLDTNNTWTGLSPASHLLLVSSGLSRSNIPGLIGYNMWDYTSANFQISRQLSNLKSLPFNAVFSNSSMVSGQNVAVVSNLSKYTAPDPYGNPQPAAATVTLIPQILNATVAAVSSEGSFTIYTVTLASYDLFPNLAAEPNQVSTIQNPNTVVVYADSNTQMLNTNAVAVGSVVRFYGLVFNDNGTLRMDCAQINDGVPE